MCGGAFRLGRQAAASPLKISGAHHLLDHAHGETLLETTVLASVAAPLVYRAVLFRQTHIFGVFLHGSFKKAFAALAGPHAIVLARRVVSTNST